MKHIHPERLTNVFGGKKLQVPKQLKEAVKEIGNKLNKIEFEYMDEYGYTFDDFSNESKVKIHQKKVHEMSSIEQQIFLATQMSKWVISETFDSYRKNGNKDLII